jgi:GntR family transcriptional regulator
VYWYYDTLELAVFEGIDPRSPVPLYAQIAARIRVAVASGEIRPGDALPSVRGLAQQLRINPATVVQAYRDLELDGFVEMRHGAGTFAREVPTDRKTEERAEQAQLLARQVLQEAARLGIPARELLDALVDEVGETRADSARARRADGATSEAPAGAGD